MPADLNLARRLAAHPRCPSSLRCLAEGAPVTAWGGVLSARLPTGARIVDVAPRGADEYEWLPDLADAATAGVLLGMLLGKWDLFPTVGVEGGFVVRLLTGGRYPDAYTGETLGEAAARALLAVWGSA